MKKDKIEEDEIKTGSLLRETTSHFIRLIGDADRKARIMIVVNSILLTIGVTLLTKVIHSTPHVWISATLLICANLLTLFFSVLSVKPELHSHIGKEAENNMLHYKKCSEYSLGDYTAAMINAMQDHDRKLEAVIKDLYFYGNLLCRKYKLINTSYRVFIWGVLVSVISYIIIILLIN